MGAQGRCSAGKYGMDGLDLLNAQKMAVSVSAYMLPEDILQFNHKARTGQQD
jgi:hypothetical protein